jgi:hypothetical protein
MGDFASAILATGTPDDTLNALLTEISDQESPLVEFAFLSQSTDTPGQNIITFVTHDDPVALDPLVLKQVPPGLDADGAGDLLDGYIDQGLNPLGKMFQIFVPDAANQGFAAITVLPLRQGPVPPVGDISTLTNTKATVFGLNPNGSIDREDNGVGSPALGSINTRNPDQKGAAIPIALAKKLFGSLKNTRGKSIEITRDNGLSTTAPIVDFGPSTGQVA